MALRLEKFNELLQDMDLYHDYHPLLVENGFDNWESISYLTAEVLADLGVTNDIKVKEILACVEAISTIKDEQEILNESGELIRKDSDLIEEVKQGGRSRSDSRTSNEGTPQKSYPITEVVISKGTSLKRDRKESSEKFFSKVIQLYLNEKGITAIDNLHMCPNLQALYLYGNNIRKMENLDSLVNLTQLNLQGNKIKKIENLQNLKNLKKLTLSKNMIKIVEGLEYCNKLEELYISNQQILEELQFDKTSLAIISDTLIILESDGNKITNPAPLAYLSNVRSLALKGNAIESVESMEGMLACMNYLTKLDLRGNPIEKIPKIRDQIVLMSPRIELFNDKKILENERAFLLKFYNIKNAQNKKKASPKNKNNSDLTVAGSNFKETSGKENQRVGDGLNRAQDFSSDTVHRLSKKSSLR